MGQYNLVVGSLLFLVWGWYISKLLSCGREIELKEEYVSVLFTLWVVNIAGKTVSRAVRVVIDYQYDYDPWVLVDFLYDVIKSVLTSSLGLMGLGFGVICLGYIHSRYKYESNSFHDAQN